MPSSVRFGSRPMIFTARAYSSGVRPCWATISGVIVTREKTKETNRQGAKAPSKTRRHTGASRYPSRRRTMDPGFRRGGYKNFLVSWRLGVLSFFLLRSTQGLRNAFEKTYAVGVAEQRVGGVLGMRHQAEHAFALIENAGDVASRAVKVGVLAEIAAIVAIAERDAAVAFEPVERSVVREIIAVVMRDRHADHLTGIVAACERTFAGFDAKMHVPAVELERAIDQQCAGQEMRLGQNLKPVADTEHRQSFAGARGDLAHDWRMRRHRATAQVVTV